jgi:hypothetical protein
MKHLRVFALVLSVSGGSVLHAQTRTAPVISEGLGFSEALTTPAIDRSSTRNKIEVDRTGTIDMSQGQLNFRGLRRNGTAGDLLTIGSAGAGSVAENKVLIANPVCIGTADPGTVLWSQTEPYKLAVNGSIRARELVIENQVGDWTAWPDYVFAPEYKLMPLNELEAWVNTHRHLPGIPSAKEVATSGVAIGELQRKLLEKVEELTLRVIELSKQNEMLARKLEAR